MPKDDLPALLLRRRIATRDQIRHAMGATYNVAGVTWIEHLLLTNVLDEVDLATYLARELALPLCDVDRLAAVSDEVLALIPTDVAVEHRIIPLSVDADGDLCAAMVDPFDRTALDVVEFFLGGRRVLREVAPATPIAWALHTHYQEPSALWPPRYVRAQTQPYLELEIS